MKKLLIAGLLTGASSFAFAGTPKTNDATAPTEIMAKDPVVKWFHFNGDASSSTDLNDPSKYTPENSPQCTSTTLTYRCDIQIQS